MIDLPEKDINEIKRVLSLHVPECRVLVFGSRVKGTTEKYSDIDLVINGAGPLENGRIERMKDDFAAGNLPISVDVVDWHRISPEFQKIIMEKYFIVQE